MSETPITYVDKDVSALCSTGLPPAILTGVFKQLLIRQFSSPDNIETDSLKRYVWTNDEKTSKIVIVANFEKRWRNVDKRPAIVIKRNSLSGRKLAIGDHLSGPDPTSTGGETYHLRGRVGSHTLFCIAENGIVAELLGQEVYEGLTEFAPLIRQDIGFSRFEDGEAGELMKLEESDTHYVVPVTFSYAFIHQWRLSPESLYYKAFNIGAEE